MPKLDWERKNVLRSKGGYLPFDIFGDKFRKSFFPHTSKLWNSLGSSVQNKNLYDFKTHTKTEMKPPKYKHFSRGTKQSNSLLTRIRVGRSYLNQHKFSIGHSDSPECLCHHKEESPQHYFLDCFLYSLERQTLFGLIEHYVPKFKRLSKKEKLNIIIFGLDIDNPDFIQLNTTLTKAVQNFILKTKRFETYSPPPPPSLPLPVIPSMATVKTNCTQILITNILQQLSYPVNIFLYFI